MKCDTLIHKTDIKVHFVCKSGRQWKHYECLYSEEYVQFVHWLGLRMACLYLAEVLLKLYIWKILIKRSSSDDFEFYWMFHSFTVSQFYSFTVLQYIHVYTPNVGRYNMKQRLLDSDVASEKIEENCCCLIGKQERR